MTRPRSMNPGVHFATARASVAAIRPSAPTEQPFAPPQKYTCGGCGVAVELELLDPLPDGWVTGVGDGGSVVYRCPACAPTPKKKGKRS